MRNPIPDEPCLVSGATWNLLLGVVRAAVDRSPIDQHAELFTAGGPTLAAHAEAHGLAPLAHDCLRQCYQEVPKATMRQLEALVLRHQIWHRERTIALEEILRAFKHASIEVVVLKGAALAWSVYESPLLRPMGDVDLLLPASAVRQAQGLLKRMGFDAPETPRRFGRNAHHLAVASRSQNGATISVEIHHDALSRDTLSSISMSNLTESPREFGMNGIHALALGHVDALRHLTHHLLEPSWDGRLRLVGVVDLLRYASIFHDRIDWMRLERSYPFVINALRCLHYVVPLPAALARFSPSPGSGAPARVGEIPRPLRAEALGQLFNPPDWWLHAYYGVPLDRSLTGVRFGRHPWRLARWVGLRASGF